MIEKSYEPRPFRLMCKNISKDWEGYERIKHYTKLNGMNKSIYTRQDRES